MGVGFVSEDSAGFKSWIWVLGLYQRTVLGLNPGYGCWVCIRGQCWVYILDMGVGFVSEDSAGFISWIWVLGLYQRTVLGVYPGYGCWVCIRGQCWD